MAVDISGYLDIIKGERSGELVREAVANAAQTLRDEMYTDANISYYLNIIRTGKYGKDIRDAIYEALRLLSISEPSEDNRIGNVFHIRQEFAVYDLLGLGNMTKLTEEVDNSGHLS